VGTDRFAALVESATDAIVTADADGRIRSWNRAAERIFGYVEAEVLGRPLTVLMPERFRALHDEGIARVAGGGDVHVIGSTVELAGLRRNGDEFPVELSLSTWVDADGRQFAGILRDVSDRKRLAHDLESSRSMMEAILRSATDPIICADERGVITMWNAAAERVLGHTEADIVGQPLTVLVPERFHDAHNAGILRQSRREEPRIIGTTVEVFAVRADGSEIPIELSLGSWELDGQRFYSGILRDVSARKEAEAALEAAASDLAEKNQQLEALSAKLAKYLSRQVYDSIFAGRTEVRVESYRKLLTVFFSDIEGFSDLTDSMEAEPLSELLNEYLSEMSKIAAQYSGTVDKFIGDGIMIFFGDPETRGATDDAVACVEMALAMKRRANELSEEWIGRGVQRELRVRIGINTGWCTVGNFGSEERLDYTIVGGQVNAASRLEVAAAPGQVLLSHPTYALVKERIHCERVGCLKVKGIAHELLTYEAVEVIPESEQDDGSLDVPAAAD
jgi:PAS domain S-box-containing protein